MPLRREATIRAGGHLFRERRRRWLSHSRRSLAVPPSSAGGDRSAIHPMRCGGAKSFVDDLVLGRGVVLSRAATSLRSIETQPLTRRFVRFETDASPVKAGWAAGFCLAAGKASRTRRDREDFTRKRCSPARPLCLGGQVGRKTLFHIFIFFHKSPSILGSGYASFLIIIFVDFFFSKWSYFTRLSTRRFVRFETDASPVNESARKCLSVH